MSEWREVALGEVVDLINGDRGRNYPSAAHRTTEGIPFINAGLLCDGRVKPEGDNFIARERFDLLRSGHVRPGDVLLCIRGSIGRVALATPDVVPSAIASSLVIVRPGPDISPRFLLALLQSPVGQRQISSSDNGVAQPNLGAAEVGRFRFPMPDRRTQDRISEILGAIDDLIENNQRRVQVLEEMARAIYREWFVRFRYPGHEDVPLVDSALGPIPNGWDLGTVANLCTRIQAGGTPRRSEPAFWSPPEVDWYKTGDLTDSVLVHSSEKISEYALSASTARLFEVETILMAIYGSPTVGRLGLVENVSSANQAALGLVADRGRSSTEHLWFVLEGLREHLNQVAQRAAQQNVSKAKVAEAPALIPPRGVVAAFTTAVGPSWRCSHRLVRQNSALASLRDLLLPKLVSGQIDVSRLDLDALTEAATA